MTTIPRCEHGVYLPEGQTKAWGCQGCYPEGHPEVDGQKLVLPRSVNFSADIDINRCPKCSGPLLSSFGTANVGRCVSCNEDFVIETRNPSARANTKQAGSCPECGSNIHYETSDKKFWTCADCANEYAAPRQVQ